MVQEVTGIRGTLVLVDFSRQLEVRGIRIIPNCCYEWTGVFTMRPQNSVDFSLNSRVLIRWSLVFFRWWRSPRALGRCVERGFVSGMRGYRPLWMRAVALSVTTGRRAVLGGCMSRTIRDVQRLTGCLVALSRFLSKSADRSFPFFQLLRNMKTWEWAAECQQAFDDLKAHLQQLPSISIPVPGETLK